MTLFNFFFPQKSASASIAKERLQIVLAHERADSHGSDFLPMLQKELLAVVARYVPVKNDMIHVNLGREGSASVLEINVELNLGTPVSAPRQKGVNAFHALRLEAEKRAGGVSSRRGPR